ncbi:MAG TPA: hypothetical protein VF131_25315 [Blastocatellia bacterium]|nr:hypothetical protein [Blastocatellia bacterium]
MQVLKTRALVAILFIVGVVFAIAVSLNENADGLAFSRQVKTSKDRNDKENIPLVIFSASQPNDQTNQTLRRIRGSRYDNRLPKPLNELSGTGLMRTTHWWINLPGLPTAQSDAVVLGKVVDATAYLSNDKSNVYSEFSIRVEDVFMDRSGSLKLGGGLTVSREGGRVQLPDGRMLYVMSSDQGMPSKGRRYLLFLKYDSTANDYNIITGYMLRRDKVSLLDEVDLDRFSTYKNMDEKSFLNAVREAVVNPPQAPRDMER